MFYLTPCDKLQLPSYLGGKAIGSVDTLTVHYPYDGSIAGTVREPVRLALAITPFNHPLNQVAHKSQRVFVTVVS